MSTFCTVARYSSFRITFANLLEIIMSIAKKWLFMLLLMASQSTLAQTTPSICPTLNANTPLSLNQALSYALCQNPDTQQQWVQILSQQAALSSANANLYPTLSLQGSASSSHNQQTQNSIGLQARASYVLFDFGQRQAYKNQANALLQQAQWNQQSVVADVSHQVISAYFTVLQSQGQISVSEQNIQANQKSLDTAQARFKTGIATPLEVLQAKSALAQTRLALVKAQSDYATQRGRLALLMGLIPTELGELESINFAVLNTPLNQSELTQLLQQAAQNRPEIKAAQANLQAAQQALIATKTTYKPTISMSAATGWQQSEGDGNQNSSIGLTIDMPFDIGGGIQAKIKQSEAQQSQQQIAIARSTQKIYQEVWQAFYQLQAAQQSIEASNDGVASSQQAAQVALARYEVGLSTMLDVLNAQSQEAIAKQQAANAQYDHLIARNNLNYSLGQAIVSPTATQGYSQP